MGQEAWGSRGRMLEWRRGYPRTPVHDDYDYVNYGYDDVDDGYDYGYYDGDGDTDKSQTTTTSFSWLLIWCFMMFKF